MRHVARQKLRHAAHQRTDLVDADLEQILESRSRHNRQVEREELWVLLQRDGDVGNAKHLEEAHATLNDGCVHAGRQHRWRQPGEHR